MSVTPLTHTLSGERMLGVDPKLARFVDADWHRRLRLYTGRALSDAAMIAEQTGRAGRLATRGQMVSPGVVSGLEVVVTNPGPGIVIETLARRLAAPASAATATVKP